MGDAFDVMAEQWQPTTSHAWDRWTLVFWVINKPFVAQLEVVKCIQLLASSSSILWAMKVEKTNKKSFIELNFGKFSNKIKKTKDVLYVTY